MSIPTKALRELRKELGRGGYRKVAEKLTCTPERVGQVLRNTGLSAKHENVINAALTVIEEKKANNLALTNKIMEAVK